MNNLQNKAKLFNEMSKLQMLLSQANDNLLIDKNTGKFTAEYANKSYNNIASEILIHTDKSFKFLSNEYQLNLDTHIEYLRKIYAHDAELVKTSCLTKPVANEIFDLVINKLNNLLEEYNTVTKEIGYAIDQKNAPELSKK